MASGHRALVRFSHTASTPARRAPSTSASGSSPTCTASIRSDARRVEQHREDPRIRLQHSCLAGREAAFEEVRETDRGEVGVAVADREQPVAPGERLESRQHVVVEHDVVAGAEEDLESLVRHRFRVPGLAGVREQRLGPEPREVVPHRRVLQRHAGAHVAHRLERVKLDHARVALRQEAQHRVLGTQDHRADVPERVVEVEDDGMDFAHRMNESSRPRA